MPEICHSCGDTDIPIQIIKSGLTHGEKAASIPVMASDEKQELPERQTATEPAREILPFVSPLKPEPEKGNARAELLHVDFANPGSCFSVENVNEHFKLACKEDRFNAFFRCM